MTLPHLEKSRLLHRVVFDKKTPISGLHGTEENGLDELMRSLPYLWTPCFYCLSDKKPTAIVLKTDTKSRAKANENCTD